MADSEMQTSREFDRLARGIGLVLEEVRRPQFRGPTMDFYHPKGGQIQLSVAGPRYREVERKNLQDAGICWSEKMGAIFVEAAPPDPNNEGKLDWANSKIVFAMSDKDIGNVLWGFATQSSDIKIIHAPEDDPKNNNKTFRIQKGEYNGKPQWTVSLFEKRNGEERRVSVFIQGPDMIRFKALLEAALPFILGLNKV